MVTQPPNGRLGEAPAGRPGEVRAPAAAAIVIAAALYALLPEPIVGVTRYVVPSLEIALLVPLITANPKRLTRQTRVLRSISFTLTLVIALANSVAFGFLMHALVSGSARHGRTLLAAALQVWLTNIIAFALLYWELDRGGPVSRARAPRSELPPADFRFSQDEDDDTVLEVASRSSETSDWRPRFIDYLYVSTTNSTAFSPTDTMPLSPRAKMLMGIQCVEALLVSILVIARGVSLLH
jgi:hypothetical protein